jgi:hypothetical protein
MYDLDECELGLEGETGLLWVVCDRRSAANGKQLLGRSICSVCGHLKSICYIIQGF